MSRTRNTITMARGTIAENARRQLSLINRCQMPRGWLTKDVIPSLSARFLLTLI